MAFSFYYQHDTNDCGPASLKMVIKHFGKDIPLNTLRDLCQIKREGVSLIGIQKAAIKLGFKCVIVKSYVEENISGLNLPNFIDLPLPNIIHWNNSHFVVVYKIKNNTVYVADPSIGKIEFELNTFKNYTCKPNDSAKVVLFEPTEKFYTTSNKLFNSQTTISKLKYLVKQFKVSKKSFYFLIFFVLLKMLIQVTAPYLTQVTFDSVIINKSINLLIIISAVQFFIFLLNSLLGYIESQITHKISLKINFSMTNEFIKKLFRVPILSVQGNQSSDFIQRTYDLAKIESFLTYNLTSISLSILTFIVLMGLLLFSNSYIFLGYIVFVLFFLLWIKFSLNKKKRIDPERFDIQVKHYNSLHEIIDGIQEIKINGSEDLKIIKIIDNQHKFFSNKLKEIKLTQLLSIGSGLINNISYSAISIYAMYLTIINQLTIGQMAAIQLIVLQLNSNLISISTSSDLIQEIKFSLERVLEIQSLEDEKIGSLHNDNIQAIELKNVSFKYSELSPTILNNINFSIRQGTTTAIVGLSGGGKTTLMKLILGMYEVSEGHICFDGVDNKDFNLIEFRKSCGIVLQDGYIFTDSILNNVTGFDPNPNIDEYNKAIEVAQMKNFVNNLPLKDHTLIGNGGISLSAGQKQRILIAKLIYKRPEFIFLDEATNSLDSETEKLIVDSLNDLFNGKTKIIIAHRLNSIVSADLILVLKDGRIVEQGTHKELLSLNNYYCKLFKEQLQKNELN